MFFAVLIFSSLKIGCHTPTHLLVHTSHGAVSRGHHDDAVPPVCGEQLGREVRAEQRHQPRRPAHRPDWDGRGQQFLLLFFSVYRHRFYPLPRGIFLDASSSTTHLAHCCMATINAHHLTYLTRTASTTCLGPENYPACEGQVQGYKQS